MLLSIGNIGYQVGAVGIIAFSVAFLIGVRWWTDHLGRVIAGVLSSMSAVLVMTTVRMLSPELATDHTYLTVRLIVFVVFGSGIWIALASFVWAQFFAKRIRHSSDSRMTTRREHKDEEADLADSRSDRDVHLHDRAGRHDR